MGGGVHVDHMTSGWSGWGALAGLCAIGLLVLVLACRSRFTTAAALGAAMLCFTALTVFTGDTHVTMQAQRLAVEVDAARWPAWAGLTLAATAALASAVPLLTKPHHRPVAAAPHGSA